MDGMRRDADVFHPVDAFPNLPYQSANRIGVSLVMVRVLDDVLVVSVVALHQPEERKSLGAIPGDQLEASPRRIVVEQRRGLLFRLSVAGVPQELKGGKMRIDATHHQTRPVHNVVQQVVVLHVLSVVDHVFQHVVVRSNGGRKISRDGIVIGISLVEISTRGKQQQRTERIRIAIEPNALVNHAFAFAFVFVFAAVLTHVAIAASASSFFVAVVEVIDVVQKIVFDIHVDCHGLFVTDKVFASGPGATQRR
mmetsp:Transcript_11775/g.33828  ORF Transcript_11775/g.33828 Transcript_11775/m.33828 type:complete len:252 (-) Transcript_11775:11-766(-)